MKRIKNSPTGVNEKSKQRGHVTIQFTPAGQTNRKTVILVRNQLIIRRQIELIDTTQHSVIAPRFESNVNTESSSTAFVYAGPSKSSNSSQMMHHIRQAKASKLSNWPKLVITS